MREELSKMTTSKLRIYVLMSGKELSKEEALLIYTIARDRITASQFVDVEELDDLEQIARIISEKHL